MSSCITLNKNSTQYIISFLKLYKFSLTNSAAENLQSLLYIGCERTKFKQPMPCFERYASFGGISMGTVPKGSLLGGWMFLLSDVQDWKSGPPAAVFLNENSYCCWIQRYVSYGADNTSFLQNHEQQTDQIIWQSS